MPDATVTELEALRESEAVSAAGREAELERCQRESLETSLAYLQAGSRQERFTKQMYCQIVVAAWIDSICLHAAVQAST